MAQEQAAPIMLAAFEALLEIRAAALGQHPDGWTAEHATWLRERRGAIGLPDPERAETESCLLEYRPTAS